MKLTGTLTLLLFCTPLLFQDAQAADLVSNNMVGDKVTLKTTPCPHTKGQQTIILQGQQGTKVGCWTAEHTRRLIRAEFPDGTTKLFDPMDFKLKKEG